MPVAHQGLSLRAKLNVGHCLIPHAPRRQKTASVASTLAVIGGLSLCAVVSTATAASEAVLPVQRVVLSTAGVGYFEHAGELSGAAQLSLPVSGEQLNDLLKSLRVADAAGQAGLSIDYPGAVPLARQLSEQGLNLNDNPSLTHILLQLRGEALSVQVMGGEQLKGRVLGVESRPRAQGDVSYEVPYLLLAAADGVRAVALDQVQRLQPDSERVREQLDKSLDLLSEHGRDEHKTVKLNFPAQSRRAVSFAYVVEAPIWKSSYRLYLPAANADSGAAGGAADSARLQAWAIVDNATPHDWLDIELALVSGRPLSFVEALYPTQYLSRPEYTPDRHLNLGPQVYGTEVAVQDAMLAKAAPAPALRAPSPAAAAPIAYGMVQLEAAAPVPGEEVATNAQAEALGASFQYVLPKVTLASQRSALLPLFEHPLKAERVSIYERAVLAKHPLQGVRLRNDSAHVLAGGPLTVYEGATYAGDARLGHVPAGAERLLSFAVDLDVSVEPRAGEHTSNVVGGRLAQGVLHVQRRQQRQHVYALRNEAKEARQVVIVQPQTVGWQLAEGHNASVAEGRYRVTVSLAPGEAHTLSVVEERVRSEQMHLISQDDRALVAWSEEGSLSPALRGALQEVAKLRRTLSEAERAEAVPEQRMHDIHAEQERIRANVQVVEPGSQLHERLIARLGEQETELIALETQLREARHAVREAQAALDTRLADLSFD